MYDRMTMTRFRVNERTGIATSTFAPVPPLDVQRRGLGSVAAPTRGHRLADLVDAPIQRLPFNEALAHHHIAGPGKYTQTKSGGVLANGNPADLLTATKVDEQADDLAALKYAATRFAPIGAAAVAVAAAAGGTNGTMNPRSGAQSEPFVYVITVPYRRGEEHREFGITYQWAVGTPGYIVRLSATGEGNAASMVTVVNPTPNAAGLAASFFSTHAATGATALGGMIHQDPNRTQGQNEASLDARTKLAGEGARFNFVRDNMDRIADDSRIYMKDSGNVYWDPFKHLWLQWAGVFNSGYGISDSTVAAALRANQWNVTKLKKFGPLARDIDVTS
jgi:hypothetical protein